MGLIASAALATVAYGTFPLSHGDHIDLTGRDEVEIRLTSSGFMPQKSYVTRGTRVTFITEGPGPFWPASDLHPFHTIYPAFDPRTPIAASSSWSFVFETDGHWNFHDHIGLATGAIIVVPPGAVPGPQFDVMAECDQRESSGRQACWKQHVALAFENGGLPAALDEIARLHRKYGEFRAQCHLHVHDLGLTSYATYGDFVPRNSNIAACGFGFYHGYMEGFLSRHDGDIGAAARFCTKTGTSLNHRYPLAGRQCMHGIGHGMMEYLLSTRGDLMNDLPQLVSIGLTACGELPDDDARFRCASGAYAVLKDWINIQRLQPRYADLFSLEDPIALCKLSTTTWGKDACAWELAKQLHVLSGWNIRRMLTAEWRAGMAWENGAHLHAMITSTSFLLGEKGVNTADEILIAQCRYLPTPESQLSCIGGTVQGLIFNASPGDEIPRPLRFCTDHRLTTHEQNTCVDRIITSLTDSYGVESRPRVCAAWKAIAMTASSTECDFSN